MPGVLATDLDGTLIPLPDEPQNRDDLRTLGEMLAARSVTLVFITGRHFESAAAAIDDFQLPPPQWLICDVGTSIYRRDEAGTYELIEDYQDHQAQITRPLPIGELAGKLEGIEGLRRQEDQKQGPFKLSYYADASRLDQLADMIQQRLDDSDAPWGLIHSVDPFNGDGLLDLLPASVSKAHALDWWVERSRADRKSVVFAGDSGNDLAAMTAGYRTIVVGNADRRIAQQAWQAHQEAGWRNRLRLVRGRATSGVLEGCRWFDLVPRGKEPDAADVRPTLGAVPVSCDTTHFAVWAPRRERVEVEVERLGQAPTRHQLQPGEAGRFESEVAGATAGDRYWYVLDGQQKRPDPRSRRQPLGVHGPSEVVDADAFPWTDRDWRGVPKRDLVIYELHLGAFTEAGTFRAAIGRLDELVELGVTAIELMPVAQSPGRWNWGYDGVNLFAPRNTFGHTDHFKALVDACHSRGLAVLLDVVYNHLGPEGNYLGEFGPYFSEVHHTPWGEALNFDGPEAEPVRRLVVDNVLYWLEEFHLDGLRMDAVHFMQDDRQPSIVEEIRSATAELAHAAGRHLHMIAETNVYDQRLLDDAYSLRPYDAIWCDCLMHSIHSHAAPELRLTRRRYRGAADIAQALTHGYVYASVESARTPPERAEPADHPGAPSQPQKIPSLVIGLQTHDVVGNHPRGQRFHHRTSKACQRAAAALPLLYPGIPLLFMGEESAVDAPFPFFVDFEDPALRKAVELGRAREYPEHLAADALVPTSERTFYAAKCHAPQAQDLQIRQWYAQLLALRKTGLTEGWLSSERMTAGWDERWEAFYLAYRCEDGGQLVVLSRLERPADAAQDPHPAGSSAIPRPVGVENVLLSSEPLPESPRAAVELQPNHAVVIRLGRPKSS